MTTDDNNEATVESSADADAELPQEAPADANREAARYRVRLRETETALQALQERLTSHQRRDAERIASQALSRADDVWLAGVEPKDLLADDDSGLVSDEKVQAAVEKVLEGRPQLKRGFPDLGGGRRGDVTESSPSWANVLRGQ